MKNQQMPINEKPLMTLKDWYSITKGYFFANLFLFSGALMITLWSF